MTTNTYILTGKRLDGHIEVTYINGLLNAVTMPLKSPLTDVQFEALKSKVSMHERDLANLKLIGITCECAPKPNEQIALFCRKYLQYKGIKYVVGKAEAGKVKLVKFDELMLDVYFTSQSFSFKDKHCIHNLVKFYNELRAEVAAGIKSKYPAHFDRDYFNKLPAGEQKMYLSHLTSLGLVPKQVRGVTVDWVKKGANL